MAPVATLEQFLGVEGSPVVVVERSADQVSEYLKRFEKLAPWLRVEHHPDPSAPVPVAEVRATRPHGLVRFVGKMENRMLEPMVLFLRAVATGDLDLDTPATPAFVDELPSGAQLRVVVSVTCPFCPVASAVALRLAAASAKVSVTVIRADAPGAPRVQAVPSIWDGDEPLVSGPVQEMQLVQLLLEKRGVRI